jgi:3'-phosphoadenosine 5'-phosphosulfate sulfotransferase (PAPS reductase)/FAD synthetase
MSAHPVDLAVHPVVANVSGGKDSTALSLWLTEQGIEHVRIFADTGWEHPDTYRYLDYLDTVLGEIERVRPKLGMRDLILKKGMFPGRKHRYCTSDLKIRPINEWMDRHDPDYEGIVALGIRADESRARAELPEWELGGAGVDRVTWRPLIAWTLDDVIAIHKRHGVRPNPLYLAGASRVGCWPCIYATKSEIRLIADTDPARITQIEDLERALKTKRMLRMLDPEYAAKAIQRRYRMPTFFAGKKRSIPIAEAVEWSRTTRGGKQLDLLGPDPDAGCMRWGLCDTTSGGERADAQIDEVLGEMGADPAEVRAMGEAFVDGLVGAHAERAGKGG